LRTFIINDKKVNKKDIARTHWLVNVILFIDFTWIE